MSKIDLVIANLSEYIKKHDGIIGKYRSQLEEMKEDYSKVLDINIDDYEESFGSEVANMLKGYQILFGRKFFPATDDQKKDFLNLLIKLENIVLSDDEICRMKELKNKLDNIDNSYLDSNDLLLLHGFLEQMKMDKREMAELLQEVVVKSLTYLNRNGLVTSDDDDISRGMTQVEMVDLFDEFKYGYALEVLSPAIKQLALREGNYLNARGILQVFEDNKIRLDFRQRGLQIIRILVYSTPEIVLSIIKDIKNQIADSDKSFYDVFMTYLSNPGYFIKSKKKRDYVRRKSSLKTENIGGVEKSRDRRNEYVASFENCEANRKFFVNLGVKDINAMFVKCNNVFSNPHEKIVRIFNDLEFYGIPREVYLNKTLTCFNSYDILSTIDQFIELGLYDYLLNNFSFAERPYNHQMFYRIVKARLESREIFYSNNPPKLLGEITEKKGVGFGVNHSNGPQVVEQYQIEPELFSEYDKEVDKVLVSGPIVLAKESEYINILDNSRFKKSDREYIFNGVVISRKKVLRYFEAVRRLNFPDDINSLRYAIYKHSILNIDQYRKVEDCLDYLFRNTFERGRS